MLLILLLLCVVLVKIFRSEVELLGGGSVDCVVIFVSNLTSVMIHLRLC